MNTSKHQVSNLIRRIYSILIGLLILCIYNENLQAQDPTLLSNKKLREIVKPESKIGWIEFKEGLTIRAENVFLQHKTAFGLSPQDDMRLRKEKSDELGFRHLRFQQYHKGLKVDGAEYIVHEYDEKLTSANGILALDLDIAIQPSISESQAIKTAIGEVGASKYYWDDPEMEAELKTEFPKKDTSYYPNPELLILPLGWEKDGFSAAAQLAYRIEIRSLEPLDAQAIYIDAHDGTIIKKEAIMYHYCLPVTAKTTWHGNRSINISTSGSNFILNEGNCALGSIHTRFQDSNNRNHEYTSTNAQYPRESDIAGVTTHWALRTSHNYFKSNFNRNGWDGKNGRIKAYNRASWNNASWSSGSTFYGLGNSGDNDDNWNTIDIVGHEFSHGVIGSSAGLKYQGESGALNEAIADIFGTMIERYVEGSSFDWEMGEDKGSAVRNLSNPKAKGQPDTYRGTNWVNTNSQSDNGGVHTNSGVFNYWFYLVAMGGSGTNDNGDDYRIQGIGIHNTAKIVYRALTEYSISSTDFVDMREATIRAAKHYFGICKPEVIEVAYAWEAIGVGEYDTEYDLQICDVPPAATTTIYYGINTLTAAGSGSCFVKIYDIPNQFVGFRATEAVILKPGFWVESGAHFSARLDKCSITSYDERGPYLASLRLGNNDGEGETPPIETSFTRETELKLAPNPFSRNTTISFKLPEDRHVKLYIRNHMGQIVDTIIGGEERGASLHKINFNGTRLSAGIYFCVLEAGEEILVHKMVITQ